MEKTKVQQQGAKESKVLGCPRGFTLVEVMVVIGIIGILAAIAIPTFLNWQPNIRLKSAARDLYSNLQRARMQALKENQTIQVRFVDTAGDDTLYFDLNGNGDPPDPGEYIFNITNYGSGVGYGTGTAVNNWNGDAISGPVPATPLFSFSNRGTANQATVYLENENQDICYAVTVVATGSIKLRKFNSPGWN